MRQIITFLTRIKSKLQNFHTWITGFLYQFYHRWCQKAKVFCNNFFFSQFFLHGTENIVSRALFPVTVLRSGFPVRNRIISVESTKMINTYHIIALKASCQPLHPPGITGLFVMFPVIQRITPQLPGGRKCIGRASRYCYRLTILVKLEQLRIRPGI